MVASTEPLWRGSVPSESGIVHSSPLSFFLPRACSIQSSEAPWGRKEAKGEGEPGKSHAAKKCSSRGGSSGKKPARFCGLPPFCNCLAFAATQFRHPTAAPAVLFRVGDSLVELVVLHFCRGDASSVTSWGRMQPPRRQTASQPFSLASHSSVRTFFSRAGRAIERVNAGAARFNERRVSVHLGVSEEGDRKLPTG